MAEDGDTKSDEAHSSRLLRPADFARDHVRGGTGVGVRHTVIVYSDYLCPYCRRLRVVLSRLRETLGDRMAYVFRHFPNESAHPGATLMSRAAEAAHRQGLFWPMHDGLYETPLPLNQSHVLAIAKDLGLDLARFERDLHAPETAARVEEDVAEGRLSSVAGTPTIFIDGVRYDGAWDYHSMLEALDRPVAAQVQRQVRAFASLPASAALVLLAAASAALVIANSPLEPFYRTLIDFPLSIGPTNHPLSLTVGAWISDGLLAIFFLLVGLEIRREMTSGALARPRAAILPAIAALGGCIAPAAIYFLFNEGATARGWAIPTATDIAFALGVLALLGKRVPTALFVFVAALAVVDDVLSVSTLAIFFAHDIDLAWLAAAAVFGAALFALNRARVYIAWPYLIVAAAVWFALHEAGVDAALTGVILAAFLPTRPAPQATPLLAQAATALDVLDQAERDKSRTDAHTVREWARAQLAAAGERMLSPAERIERAVDPWSGYVILPLFAFSAAGITLDVDFSAPGATQIAAGVIFGLVIGKPLGICLAALAAVRSGLATGPRGVSARQFVGAACLCGIGDTISILMADQAFGPTPEASIAKIAVLAGSLMAACLGAAVLTLSAHRAHRRKGDVIAAPLSGHH